MGAVIADIDPGGDRSESVGEFLQSGVAGGIDRSWEDVGAYPRMEQALDSLQHRVA